MTPPERDGGRQDGKHAPPVPRGAAVASAYQAIRERILDGRLRPGTKLVVRPLSAELGISPTPVKTALAALERDGFALAILRRGYFVPTVEPDDMHDIYQLREVVDGIAARTAAQHLAPGLPRRLDDLIERQREVAAVGDLPGYNDSDLAFHDAIWHASGNTRLTRIAETLRGQVRLGSASSAQAPGRLPVALDEHTVIAHAIRTGDPDQAERLARAHVANAWRALEDMIGTHRPGRPVATSRQPTPGRLAG